MTRKLTRRHVLKGVSAVGAASLGCGSEETKPPTTHHGTSGTGGAGGMGGGSGGYGGVGGAGMGGGGTGGGEPADLCVDDSNLSPAQLLAPIETIVVLCMENRSFDHYLGARALLEGAALDGLSGAESNPAPDGTPVLVHPLDTFTPADPPHEWDDCHAQFDGGANDGFVVRHAGASQDDVMGYYVREQVPAFTGRWPTTSCACDRWFCSVMGPTWPNRFYLHGATSNGVKTNLPAGRAFAASSARSTTPGCRTPTTSTTCRGRPAVTSR